MLNGEVQNSDRGDRYRRGVKLALYHVAKYAGFFALARRLTRSKLRILCYHGFSIHDECVFRPKLFVSSGTLRRRLQYLTDKKYPVLALREALEKLDQGTLPNAAIAITIDDGFHSTHAAAWPLLKEFAFPATVYVTSYYVLRGGPIFRLATQYLFWKTAQKQVDLSDLGLPAVGLVSLENPKQVQRTMWEIIRFAEESMNEGQRRDLLQTLSQRLRVDLTQTLESRTLSLLAPQEIQEMAKGGVDIQLHTHRHRFPEDEAVVSQEIQQNREALAPFVEQPLEHFCYPSGIWSSRHWPWLSTLGIRSATTCEQGSNTKSTPRFALRRFLDGENIAMIEFEAEVSGFSERLRRLAGLLKPRPGDPQRAGGIAPDGVLE